MENFRCRRTLGEMGRSVNGTEIWNALREMGESFGMAPIKELEEDIDHQQKFSLKMMRTKFCRRDIVASSIGIFLYSNLGVLSDSDAREQNLISLCLPEGCGYNSWDVYIGNVPDTLLPGESSAVIEWVEKARSRLIEILRAGTRA